MARRYIWFNIGKYFLITYDPFYHRKYWATLIGVEMFSDEKTTDIFFRIYKLAFAICIPKKETKKESK